MKKTIGPDQTMNVNHAMEKQLFFFKNLNQKLIEHKFNVLGNNEF